MPPAEVTLLRGLLGSPVRVVEWHVGQVHLLTDAGELWLRSDEVWTPTPDFYYADVDRIMASTEAWPTEQPTGWLTAGLLQSMEIVRTITCFTDVHMGPELHVRSATLPPMPGVQRLTEHPRHLRDLIGKTTTVELDLAVRLTFRDPVHELHVQTSGYLLDNALDGQPSELRRLPLEGRQDVMFIDITSPLLDAPG